MFYVIEFFMKDKITYYVRHLIGFPWLRLTRSDEKNHLISYDVHQIDEIQNERETFMDAGNYFTRISFEYLAILLIEDKF